MRALYAVICISFELFLNNNQNEYDYSNVCEAHSNDGIKDRKRETRAAEYGD